MLKKAACLFAILLTTLFLLPITAAGEVALRGYTKADGYQYVAMGLYPQTTEEEGILPILWRVLSVEDGEALLFSEYILGNGRIHHDDVEYIANGGAWNTTDRFVFLNDTFLQERFTEAEQSLMLESEELGTIFLLSGEEVKNAAYGLGTDKERRGVGTPYALANGLYHYSGANSKYSPYWTRSQSTTANYGARCTKYEGNLGYIRVVVENLGWRPALRIDLNKAIPIGGLGTMDDPLILGVR